MLDLQRPVARLARPFRPTGGHGSVQGSLGLKSGVGAASGGASSAAPTKTSQIFVLGHKCLRQFFSRHVASFSRERSPFERRTRTTQAELSISAGSYEVSRNRGPPGNKTSHLLHNTSLLHNVKLLLPLISATVYTVLLCYCTVLYCTVRYCTVLYCTVLYCTVLYSTVLYCTVLYCTVLLWQ